MSLQCSGTYSNGTHITIDNIKLYLIQKYLFENTDSLIPSDISSISIEPSRQPKPHKFLRTRAELDADPKEVSDSENREFIIHSGEAVIVNALAAIFNNEAIVKQCISAIKCRFNIKEGEGNHNFQTKIKYSDNGTQRKVYHISQGKKGGTTCTLFFIIKNKNKQINTIQFIAAGKHINKSGCSSNYSIMWHHDSIRHLPTLNISEERIIYKMGAQ